MSIENVLKEFGFTEFKEIDTNDVIIDPQVRKMCEANTCGFYGKNHMCPPAVEDLEVWREKIQSFPNAMVVAKMYELEHQYDMEGMGKAALEFEISLRDAKESFEKENAADSVMVLGAGPCNYCEECSHLEDLPCLYPDKAYPSVEACGIDVMSLSKKAGLTYNHGSGTVTYFGMVLYL